jgi:hypothetical protein
VTSKDLQFGITPWDADEMMNRKDFLQALVSAADSDAADNEHKPNADIEAKLLRDALVIFGGQHNFKPGIIVRDNAQLFARAKMAAGGTTLASTGMLRPRTT